MPALNPTSYRPISYEDFLEAQEKKLPGLVTHCIDCHEGFSSVNTHTALGWRETQISGFCERCFDAIFEEGNG